MCADDRSRYELAEELQTLRARIAELERSGLEFGGNNDPQQENPDIDILRRTRFQLQKLCHEDGVSSVDHLILRSAETLLADRVSYWEVVTAELIGRKRLYTRSNGEFSLEDIHSGRDRLPYLLETLTEHGLIDAARAHADERTQELVECYLTPHGISSFLAVPVLSQGRISGVVVYETTETERFWKPEECDFAHSVAQMISLSSEVAERTQSETLLIQREKEYRAFMEATPDPMVMYDTEGNVTYLNPSFTRVFGWTLGEQRGKKLDFIPKENLAETMEAVKGLLRGEKVVSLKTRRRTKDGRVLDILGSAATFRNADGTIAGSMVTLRDITEHKKIEDELRAAHEKLEARVSERTSELAETNRALEKENTERLRAESALEQSRQMLDNILNASPVAIVHYKKGKLAWLNRAMAQMFGDQPYEGRRPAEFYASAEEYRRVRSLLRRRLHEGALVETEAEFKRSDGSVFTGLLRVSFLDPQHPGKGDISIIADLSEKKRAEFERRETEDRFRRLVEDSFDGILVHNGRTITFANPRLHEMLGYDEGELTGTEYWKVFHPDDRLTIQERARARLRGEEVPSQYEVMLQRKDGTLFYVEINAQAVQLQGEVGVQVWIRDISERKRVERELVESRQTLTNILAASPVGIGKAENRLLVWCNKAFKEMFGFEDESDYLGRTTDVLYESDEEFQRVGATLYGRLEAGEHADLDASFTRKDGSLFEGHITIAPTDPLNPTRSVIAAIADISERKKAEKSLRQSEKTARALLKATPEGALLLDIEGTVLETNSVAARLLGTSVEETVGKLFTDLLPEELSENMKQQTGEVFRWGTPTRFVETFRGRFLDNTLYPLFDQDGNVIRLAVFLRDITDQKLAEQALKDGEERLRKLYEESKKSEEIYRSLLNSSADAVVIFDLEGRTTYVNPSFTRIFGWTMEEVEGRRIDFVPKSEREATTEVIRSVVWEGKPWSDFETKRYTKGGEILDVSVSASRHNDHEGNPVGTMVILRDITERKRAEGKLAEALQTAKDLREQAESSSMAKSDFVANMSHEVRTPMNAIIGLTELALRSEPSPKMKDYLTKISSSSRNLLGIINDILDFSKIEAGKLDLESVDFDLRDVVGGLTDLLGDAASRKGLEFLAVVGPDVPCALTGDPLRLGQVLTNLTNNAVKFTEEGEIVVKATLVEKDRHKATIDFSVKDSGIGIEPEKIAKLFQSFTQADGSTTRKYGGSGLGLTICKRLIEMMGGRIRVESEPGTGSTFTFRLELVRQPVAEGGLYKGLPDLEGLKVLVVDDNRMAREILLEMLKSFSFEAVAVGSGEEALTEIFAASKETPYDLVLMDFNMPGMNGIETSIRIDNDVRLTQPVPKIIMVTVHGTEAVMKQAEQAGLEGFLTKPVNQSLLFDTIMEIFGRKVERTVSLRESREPDGVCAEPLRGTRILLAEDNEINQQVATEILESVGARVHIAHNGLEAIKAATESDFDAVLMDIQMPEMDGYEATQKIRANPHSQNLPIIAMTAHALKGDREKCLAAGMNDHLTKPIGIDEVVSTLAHWIDAMRTSSERPDSESISPKPVEEPPLPQSVAGLRIQSALRRFGGNTGLLLKILGNFVCDYPHVVDEIKDALAKGDMELGKRLAHTLKGVAANIGADDLSKAAGDLESSLDRDEFYRVDELCSRVQERLRQAIDSASVLTDRPECVTEIKDVPEREGDPDSTELTPLFTELHDLIRRSHFRASQVAQSVREKVGHKGPQDELMRLQASLEKFDFRSARETLISIAESLSIAL